MSTNVERTRVCKKLRIFITFMSLVKQREKFEHSVGKLMIFRTNYPCTCTKIRKSKSVGGGSIDS